MQLEELEQWAEEFGNNRQMHALPEYGSIPNRSTTLWE